MSQTSVNGFRLYYEAAGDTGEPLVLVHGAWGDHHDWNPVVSGLAHTHRVLTYDRRGHSLSERSPAPVRIEAHASDLACLIQDLNLAPAHVVGSSFGASIALTLSTQQPDLFLTLSVHEPPLIGLLGDTPEGIAIRERLTDVVTKLRGGDIEEGARLFVDTVAFGPGSWDRLSETARRKFIFNAPTFFDEVDGPGAFRLDLAALSRFTRPVMVTRGDRSPSYFAPILERIAGALPAAVRHTFGGAGHLPQITHPADFVRVIGDFARATAVGDRRR